MFPVMKTLDYKKPAKQREEIFCPECGAARTEWRGAGITRNGERYCCDGCADGTGCTCEDNFEY